MPGPADLSVLRPPLSRPVALSATMLVLANLLPLWGLVRGDLTLGEVFVLYWAENVVVWLTWTVKIASAGPLRDPSEVPNATEGITAAMAFAVHYGLFTAAHGFLVWQLATETGGVRTDEAWWVWSIMALAVSHLVSLVVNWFGRGERRRTTPSRAMFAPYPRMVVMHVCVFGAFWLLDGGSTVAPVLAALLLCGSKTVVDLLFHGLEHVGWPTRR